MELRVLRYFLTVAKEQSFTKAAEQLHITQPTLSRQLAALEEELGTVLFNRGGRNVTLTDEGILLKRRALEIIDLEDKIREEFKESQVVDGTITIGCVRSSGAAGTDLRAVPGEISDGSDPGAYRNSRYDL